MKKSVGISVIVMFLYAGSVFAQLPELSKKEKSNKWILLFDGKTAKGWKSVSGKPFPEEGWKIDNGVLSVKSAGQGGDIITEEVFSDFELSVDFKITEGANSGIKYFILPGTNLGCEYQILDDERHEDAKKGINGNRTLGSLYDLIPASVNKKVNPVGEWNHARIVSKGKQVEHWLNGKKILSYERGSDAFNALVAGSKFKDQKDFATPVQSPILLQDHGDVVYFRNIKIRKL
ncbi:MAG: DUF1080 domain-containing protein [Bacteroidales bacterium]|jgi:hypothetical protein|nr:DUF1080 domain-containing protein [Bacteroidales bacterium]